MASDYSYRPVKPLLPAELGSVLSSWWLAVAAGLTGLVCLWPMMMSGLQTKMNLNVSPTTGWILLALIVAAVIALCSFVSNRAASGFAAGLQQMKLLLIVGMIAGVLVMALGFWLGSGATPQPAGSSQGMGFGTLCAYGALAIMGLVPYLFGIVAFSLSGSDAINRYFTQAEQTRLQEANRPADVTTSYAPPPPVEEEAMAVDAPAEVHAADLDAILEEETSSVQVTLDTPDKPSTQVRKTKDTQLKHEK